MRRLIAVAVAILAACAAHAAIIAGPEREVSREAFGRAYGTQHILSTASDGTDFLVVWSSDWPAARALNFSVIAADGSSRTVPSRTLRVTAIGAAYAVWTGDAYLLVWSEPDASAIYVARITRDGAVDGAPVLVHNDAPSGLRAVVFDGHEAFVAYSPNPGVSATLIDDHGRVLHDMRVTNAANAWKVVASAAAGKFVIAWTETGTFGGGVNTRVVATSVDSDGNMATPITVAHDLPNAAASLSAASDGSKIALAVVMQPATPPQLDRYVIDPSTLAVQSLAPIATTATSVRLASGDEIVAYWSLYRDGQLLLESIPFNGGTLREAPIGSFPTLDLSLASNGESVLAAWTDFHNTPNTGAYQLAQGALLSADRSAKEKDVNVAVSTVGQGHATIASAGNVALVAWLDLKDTYTGNVVAERVDAQGRPLDAPFVLATNVPAYAPPVVGFTGHTWMVAFAAPDSTLQYLYRRVSTSGVILDDTPQDLGFGAPVFASNGKVVVIAGAALGSIVARRFTVDGIAIDSEPVVVAQRPGYSVAIGASNDEFLVAWNEGSNWWQFPTPGYRSVYGARLDANGSPIDAAPIAIANGPFDEANARIASDGRDFMVALLTFDNATFGAESSGANVRVKKVLHEGTLSDTTSGALGKLAGVNAMVADIAYTNGRYTLAFLETTFAGAQFVGVSSIDADGELIDSPGMLANSSTDAPVIAGVAGIPLVAYTRYDIGDGIPRVFIRALANGTARGRGARH